MGFIWGLALVFAISAVADHAPTAPAPRLVADYALPDALRCTPLETLLRKNGRALPKNDADWDKLFAKIGGTGPDQYFSTSNAKVDLLDPRRIFTAKSTPKKDPTEESLYGRLFVAVGKNEEGNRVAEFVTQDARTGHFLFGTIDPTKARPIRIDALNDCKQCHKTAGPLYSIYPWTHSSANVGNQVALVKLLAAREGEPYKSALKEIRKIAADVRRELGDADFAALKKFGKTTMNNQLDDEYKIVSRTTRMVLERMNASEPLKELRYQGVPIFRNPAYPGGRNETYSHDGSGAHDLHSSVQFVHEANAMAHAFYSEELPQNRAHFLNRLMQAAIQEAPMNLSYSPGAAGHSSLTSDAGIGPGTLTTINSADSFFSSLVVDADSAVAPIIELHEKMTKTKVGDAPKALGLDPRNSAHYDDRGRGSTLTPVEKSHSIFGITSSARMYFATLVYSRGGDVDKAFAYALEAKWMKELYGKNTMPSAAQVKIAVMKGIGEYMSVKHSDPSVLAIPMTDYLSALEIECLKYLERPLDAGDSCVRCHGSESHHARYMNDLAGWEKDLKAGDPKAKSLLTYLKKNVMPPVDTPEDLLSRDSSHRKALKDFLNRH